MSAIFDYGRRLDRRLLPRPVRFVIGLGFDVVGNGGLVLAALGVAPSLAWVWAGAVAVGTGLLLSVIWSYETELQAYLAPSVLADEVNLLRGRLRDLMKDAYKPPAEMPRALWEATCAALLDDCRAVIANHRNKFTIPLRDAIEGRLLTPLKIGKNRQTMDMLNRVDTVLSKVVDEIAYTSPSEG